MAMDCFLLVDSDSTIMSMLYLYAKLLSHMISCQYLLHSLQLEILVTTRSFMITPFLIFGTIICATSRNAPKYPGVQQIGL